MNHFILFCFFLSFSIIGYLFGSILLGPIFARRKLVNIRSVGSGNVGSTNITRALGLKIGFLTYSWDCVKSWISIFISILIYSSTKYFFSEETYANNGHIVYASGFFTIIGHCFPINYIIALFKNKFNFEICKGLRGGKGAAATSGYFMALSPWIYIIAFTLFWTCLAIIRYVSVSSIFAIFMGFVLTTIPNLNFMYMLDLGSELSIISIGDSVDNFTNPMINYQMNSSYLYFNIFSTLLIFIFVTYMHKVNIRKLIDGKESKLGSKKNNK